MSIESLPILPIELRDATEREYAALNDFQNQLEAERIPEDPPTPLAERISWWRDAPPQVVHQGWVVWNSAGTQIIADAGATFRQTEENQHAIDFGIGVRADYRRQGLARRIMAVVADYAERQQRPTLLSFTTDRIPGGAAFMACMGAERGLENHLNQLLFADLDHALVQRWITQAEQHATDFELGFWEGPYPEDQLESIARLHDVMNTAPRGTLDLEDFHVTPAMIRDWERAMAASGDVRRTVYVRERATGAFAGYSEVYWHANRPDLLWQGATGVFPQYRGYGLGRWLKAAMLVRVLNEWPNVRLIRTGNADSNAPMLKINHELGFMLYSSNTIWQIDLARVRAYLARA